jgi:hypothetical protein
MLNDVWGKKAGGHQPSRENPADFGLTIVSLPGIAIDWSLCQN